MKTWQGDQRRMQPEIYWIPSPWRGRLAILPHPRGGDWLEDEIAGFRRMGVDIVVSALEKAEEALLELTQERELCQAQGMEFISFPKIGRASCRERVTRKTG